MQPEFIIGSTGSGKTMGIAHSTIEILNNTEDFVLIIVRAKDHIRAMGERIYDKLNEHKKDGEKRAELSDLGIQMITSDREGGIKVGKTSSDGLIDMDVAGDVRTKKSRCIITHYTYMTRRGFGSYYYRHLDWVNDGAVKQTIVFIDEIDNYVEHLKKTTSNGGRSKLDGNFYTHVNKCQANPQNGHNVKCESCHFKPQSRATKYSGMFSCWQEITRDFSANDKFDKSSYHKGFRKSILSNSQVTKHQDGTRFAYSIPTAQNPGNVKFVESGGKPPQEDFTDVLDDLIQASYAPTLHLSYPTLDDNKLEWDDIIDLSEENRSRVVYPNSPCDTDHITTMDRRPLLYFLKHAKALVMFTATPSPDTEDFLVNVLGCKRPMVVSPREDVLMDNVTIVGTFTKLKLTDLAVPDTDVQPMIYITPTLEKAQLAYNALKEFHHVYRGVNNSDFENNRPGCDTEVKYVIFHSMSTLSRGLDWGEYDTVLIDNDIHKPRCVQATEDLKTMKLREAAEQSVTVIQSAGRILRKDKERRAAGVEMNKFILVENLDSIEQFNVISAEVKKMSKNFDAMMMPKGTSSEDIWKVIKRRSGYGINPLKTFIEESEKMLQEDKTFSVIQKKLNRDDHLRDVLSDEDKADFDILVVDLEERIWAKKLQKSVDAAIARGDAPSKVKAIRTRFEKRRNRK